LDYFYSPTKHKYIENWLPQQTNILDELVKYISQNWNDVGEYNEKYQCSFPLNDFRYIHMINQ
jgi:hypothetical protein